MPKNEKNRSSLDIGLLSVLAAITAISVGSCAPSSAPDYPKIVEPSDYLSIDKCWKITDRSEGLLVVDEAADRQYVSFFLISPICDVVVRGYPAGLGFLEYIDGIHIASDGGLANDHFSSDFLEVSYHFDFPDNESPIYFFSGSIEKLDGCPSCYAIARTDKLERSKHTLGDLKEMTAEERWKFFESSRF